MSTIRTALLSAAVTLALVIGAYFAFAVAPAQAASASSGSVAAHAYTNQVLQQYAQNNGLGPQYPRQIGMPR